MESHRDTVASILYSVDSNGEMIIDVEMEDYSPDTIVNFSSLFAAIPSTNLHLQAMNILQEAFARDGKGVEFENFALSVMQKSALIEYEEGRGEGLTQEKYTNDPLIKPTDLL